MRLVILSDTHNLHRQLQLPLPEADVLIHAGDFTNIGGLLDVIDFNSWLGELPYRRKVIVSGNHERGWDKEKNLATYLTNADYLQESSLTIDGINFYGSPRTPEFGYNWAFNVPRGQLKPYWDRIPENLDILITHGPPMNVLDRAYPHLNSEHLGDQELLEAVERVKPKFHVFGHFHGGYGMAKYLNTTFINAAICTEQYVPLNKPWVIEV